MRHIIIEGPDGAGKTRLARYLCHKHTMAYHHEGPPPDGVSVLHHYAKLLVNARRPTVFDRLHLGEVVYAPLLRGRPGLAPHEVVLMNRLIAGQGTTLIGCLPSWETCYDANRSKEELIKDKRTLRAAYDSWRVVFNGHEHEFFHVNACAYNWITDRLFELRPTDRLPDGVIGRPNARVLFIGEQPNSDTLDLPFFGTQRSSGYLNARIAEAGLSEHELAFTNALDMTGNVRDLHWIVSQMPRVDTVVALGRIAFVQLERQHVPFVKVLAMPHPSFWKRFHNSETREYTRMLEVLRAA